MPNYASLRAPAWIQRKRLRTLPFWQLDVEAQISTSGCVACFRTVWSVGVYNTDLWSLRGCPLSLLPPLYITKKRCATHRHINRNLMCQITVLQDTACWRDDHDLLTHILCFYSATYSCALLKEGTWVCGTVQKIVPSGSEISLASKILLGSLLSANWIGLIWSKELVAGFNLPDAQHLVYELQSLAPI